MGWVFSSILHILGKLFTCVYVLQRSSNQLTPPPPPPINTHIPISPHSLICIIYTDDLESNCKTVANRRSRTRSPPPPPPPVDCITRLYYDFSQHEMFTICIIFATLQKLRVCSNPRTASPPPPPHPSFEIPGSATGGGGGVGGRCYL